MVVVSSAPFNRLEEYRRRMGWSFKWVSSGGSDFNFDYNVSFTPDEMAAKRVFYNYKWQQPQAKEREGHSFSIKMRTAPSFTPTRATTAATDKLNVHYHYLDLVPKGRDEGGRGPYWVRRRDEYDR